MTDHDMDVACQAAETFTTHFYHSINDLSSLDSFYISACPAYAATPPQIAVNGHQLSKPSEYEFVLRTQANGLTKRVNHTIQSLDAQVLNPRYLNGAPEWVIQQNSNSNSSHNKENRVEALSILIQITGLVRYGNDRDAPPPRNFSEHLVLVPNWDAMSSRGSSHTPRGARRWLIQSQIWRAL